MQIHPSTTTTSSSNSSTASSNSLSDANSCSSNPSSSGETNDAEAIKESQPDLVKCEWCERSFDPKRLIVHHRSCTKEKPAKRVGAPLKEKWQTKLAEQKIANIQKLIKNAADANPSMNNPSKVEMSEINFKYADEDSYKNELAEIYSYSEMKNWAIGLESFQEYCNNHNLPQQFNSMEINQKKMLIADAMQMLESISSSIRLEAARIVLYLLQGAYGDFATTDKDVTNVQSEEKSGYEHDCLLNGVINAYFCYQQGLYPALCTMLLHEIHKPFNRKVDSNKSKSQYSFSSDSCKSSSVIDIADTLNGEPQNKQSPTLADNESIRIVLSCIYHMLQAIKHKNWIDKITIKSHYSIDELQNLQKQFLTELEEPLQNAKIPLSIVLFNMLPSFAKGENPHYPLKKVLLLIWKIILTTLGGFEELKEEKNRQRRELKLPIMEDTIEVGSQMKAANVNSDGQFVDYPGIKNRSSNPPRFISRQTAFSSGDGSKENIEPQKASTSLSNSHGDGESTEENDVPNAKAEEFLQPSENSDAALVNVKKNSKFAGNIQELHTGSLAKSTLPWKPKVSESQIEKFLQKARQKHLGFTLPGDLTTTFGLPLSTNTNLKILNQHIYKSTSEIQIENEEKYNRFSFTQKEKILNTSTERLYVALLPKINDYLMALLKILLTALPNSEPNNGISILSDVLAPKTKTPEMLSSSAYLDTTTHNIQEEQEQVALDAARHKEIIVKSISGILILLLKWLKLNHIYQYEFIVQQLISLNCIPLILKFLDQNMIQFIQAKNELTQFSYPFAPLFYARNDKWPLLSAEKLDDSESSKSYYSWRNVFSSINIARVLNKITKGNQARTMMLVIFKSAPILKRCLRVKSGLFQLYCLKLLKSQSRYLGSQWRKANMDLVSTIYLRVRHRLTDDWAYAHETRANKPWDNHHEAEKVLKLAIDKFHSRRYSKLYPQFKFDVQKVTSSSSKNYFDLTLMGDFEPVNNCLQSLLSNEAQISERFKRNYEKWLNDEVYKKSINWDTWLLNLQEIFSLV